MKAIVKRYFEEHGFTAALAKTYGVVVSGSTIHYRCFDRAGTFFRTRDLEAERKATRQPRRRRLDVCYLTEPPAWTTHLLLCEGEPDTLAAHEASRMPSARAMAVSIASYFERLAIGFLPGTATPAHKVIAEMSRLGASTVFLAFDNDYAGNAAAERIIQTAGLEHEARFRRIPFPEDHDLADVLAAAGNRADTLMSLLNAAR